MPGPLDKLYELARDTIRALPSGAGWERGMRETIARAHTAAYMAGVAERTGVPPKGLSKAERADVKKAVEGQLTYLAKFATAKDDLSEAQTAARADMYAGAVRSSYYSGRHPGLSQYPGDGGTQCLTNCLCSLDERDDGIYWVLDGGEHCADCEAMAAGSPYSV